MDVIDSRPMFDESYAKMRYNQYLKAVQNLYKNHQTPHDRRYRQKIFIPSRPIKCGNIMETNEPQPIICRSGWEIQVCNFLDKTDSVVRWFSEPIKILYPNPITKKMSYYIPDIYVEFLNKDKKIEKWLWEIKPLKEASLKESSNGYDRLMVAKNAMKWKSTIEYCKKRDMKFKVITEYDLGLK